MDRKWIGYIGFWLILIGTQITLFYTVSYVENTATVCFFTVISFVVGGAWLSAFLPTNDIPKKGEPEQNDP